MSNTRLDAQNRYDEIIDIMTPGSPTYNPFIDNYINFKIRNKMKYFFGNIENWLGRETWEWNDEDRIATEIITSCDVIEDYITFLETILTSGGGGSGDITGSGTAGCIALWDANKNITSDGELLYDSTNDILTVENISHTGNYKENVIVVNSDTTLGNTHSHIVCVTGASPYEITLQTITSSNVKIRYDLKNISSEVVNLTTDGTQTFDGDVITDLTLGVGNQITLVATEISTGVYTWVTFN